MVNELTECGVQVQFVKEGLTFTGQDSPMNNLLLSMLGAVAEFERSNILERQREGIAVAKAKGKYKGGKPKLSPEQIEELRTRREDNESPTALAKEFGISRATVYNLTKSEQPPSTTHSPLRGSFFAPLGTKHGRVTFTAVC